MVEQGTHNPLVLGSNPGGPTIRKHLPSLRVAAFLFVRHSFIQSILCACAVLRKSNAIYAASVLLAIYSSFAGISPPPPPLSDDGTYYSLRNRNSRQLRKK